MSEQQWFWMMNWCKAKGVAPANPAVWELAKKAYREDKPNE